MVRHSRLLADSFDDDKEVSLRPDIINQSFIEIVSFL